MPRDLDRASSLSAVPLDRDWNEVIAFLADPATHGLAEPVLRVDTHAAVVLLAGPLAYKVKRPVRFPFLDYGTFEARRVACLREIAIDLPIAPEIYRRAVAITREADGRLAIDGAGVPVEWAVEMNRFDETATLDHRLARGPLDPGFVDALAVAVATAQARAQVRDWQLWIADLGRYIGQNAVAFAARPDLFPPAAAAALERSATGRLADLDELLHDRGRLGRVRLGHGDLHCGNVAVIDDRPQVFDAIEFDDAIATGDILYDAGFLVMDLVHRGDRVAACRFLSRWLIETVRRETGRDARGDAVTTLLDEIGGLAALPLFLSIRAALRAKIAAATARRLAGVAAEEAEVEARRLFAAARAHLAPATPCLVAIGGLSGAGKTTLAQALAADFDPAPGALVIRTDALRKLVAGVAETSRLGAEFYTREASARIYATVITAASRALAAGRSVIVDAVALAAGERARFAEVAEAAEARFAGIWLDVDPARAQIRAEARRGDASDADAAVVAFQAERDPGPLDWTRLDANGTEEETLAAARLTLAALRRAEV